MRAVSLRSLAFLALLASCGAEPETDEPNASDTAAATPTPVAISPPIPAAAERIAADTALEPSDAPSIDSAQEPTASCWADYCPCDESDPDYGFADVPICRNLKMGVAVDDDIMAGAAVSRDARRAIREHKEQYGEF